MTPPGPARGSLRVHLSKYRLVAPPRGAAGTVIRLLAIPGSQVRTYRGTSLCSPQLPGARILSTYTSIRKGLCHLYAMSSRDELMRHVLKPQEQDDSTYSLRHVD